jgi:hypothetical protein
MPRLFCIIVVALTVATLAGCSTQIVRVESFSPSPPQPQKMPLKVAIVVDKKANPQPVTVNMQMYHVNLVPEMEPSLSEALKKEFEGIFEEVTIAQTPAQAQSKDVLVTSNFKIKESGIMAVECRLEVILRDSNTNTVINRFERTENLDSKPPGSVNFYSFMTGLTLFMGAPIFLPLAAVSHGDKILESANTVIPEMVRTIGRDVTFDRSLALLARKDPAMQQFLGASLVERRGPISEIDTVPSSKRSARKDHYAIVIGIETYREKLPKAEFAARDATLMGEYLTKLMGYPEENVVVRTNEKASMNDLVKYFENWLPNNVDKKSSVFVYYSGHGAPNPKTGDAFLVPYDGDPTFVDATGYSLKRLYAALDKLPAKEITVVLDSCFSGGGGRSVLAAGAKPMVLTVETPLGASSKTVVLAASSGDQISSTYQEKGHGLLTYFFLKGLQGDADANEDGTIEISELYAYVKPNVQKVARKQYNNEQTPQLLANPDVILKGGVQLLDLKK